MKLFFSYCNDFYDENENWESDVEILSMQIVQREGCFASAEVSIAIDDPNDFFEKCSGKYAKIGVLSDADIESQENTEQVPNENGSSGVAADDVNGSSVCSNNGNNPDSSKIKTIFRGRIVSFPKICGGSHATLELISEPSDYQKQLEDFKIRRMDEYQKIDKHQLSEEALNFEELFFDERNMENPTIFLEGDSKNFYWDMRSGKLSLSDVNAGDKNFRIDGSQVFQNSVKHSTLREPYKHVVVRLAANWTQKVSGIIDLYPLISERFENKVICSLTNIRDSLKKLGSAANINVNGDYNILRCEVREADPSMVSAMVSLPKTTSEFKIKGKKEIGVRFKKFYFQGEMLVNWNRRLCRKEVVDLLVDNNKLNSGPVKKFFIPLEAIQLPKDFYRWNFFTSYQKDEMVLFDGFVFKCKEDHISDNKFDESKWEKVKKTPDALLSDSCGSFFKTERGKNAIKYALQHAVAVLNASARYAEVTFSVDAEKFLFISVNDQVTLDKNCRIFSENTVGKVIKTKFIANGDRKVMQISIGCSFGKHFENPLDKINEYMKNLKINVCDKIPVSSKDIVKDIRIFNTVEDQEKLLEQTNAKSVAELKTLLRKYATRIKMTLLPQRIQKSFLNVITLPKFNLSDNDHA